VLAAFGVLALVLSAVGLFGVLSYSVAQRTREMGVRIAIGASRRDVLGLIVGRAMRLTAIGLGVGIVLAAGAGQLLRSQIFGVSPLDPLTFISVIVLLAAVAFVAAWLPARRAARVDPIVALQAE
jgi:ABC-type antimicrobial peptide transport system permease subunit